MKNISNSCNPKETKEALPRRSPSHERKLKLEINLKLATSPSNSLLRETTACTDDIDEESPQVKSSRTPRHMNFRKKEFPFISTQLIEISKRNPSISSDPEGKMTPPDHIFHKISNPCIKSSLASQRYSPKNTLPVALEKPRHIKSETQKNISPITDDKGSDDGICNSSIVRKYETHISLDERREKYKNQLNNLKIIKDKAHENILRLKAKIRNSQHINSDEPIKGPVLEAKPQSIDFYSGGSSLSPFPQIIPQSLPEKPKSAGNLTPTVESNPNGEKIVRFI